MGAMDRCDFVGGRCRGAAAASGASQSLHAPPAGRARLPRLAHAPADVLVRRRAHLCSLLQAPPPSARDPLAGLAAPPQQPAAPPWPRPATFEDVAPGARGAAAVAARAESDADLVGRERNRRSAARRVGRGQPGTSYVSLPFL